MMKCLTEGQMLTTTVSEIWRRACALEEEVMVHDMSSDASKPSVLVFPSVSENF